MVWRDAHRLVLAVYASTVRFPAAERFGLQSQMRRAAISIASNIVEGSGRGGDREMIRFLRYARGSASELEYQLLLARDLHLLPEVAAEPLLEAVRRVNGRLVCLMRRLAPGCTKGPDA